MALSPSRNISDDETRASISRNKGVPVRNKRSHGNGDVLKNDGFLRLGQGRKRYGGSENGHRPKRLRFDVLKRKTMLEKKAK